MNLNEPTTIYPITSSKIAKSSLQRSQMSPWFIINESTTQYMRNIPETLHTWGHCNIARQCVRNIPETLHKRSHCNIARQCVHNIPGTLHKRVHCNIPRQCFHNVAVILQCNLQPNGNIAMYCNGMQRSCNEVCCRGCNTTHCKI